MSQYTFHCEHCDIKQDVKRTASSKNRQICAYCKKETFIFPPVRVNTYPHKSGVSLVLRLINGTTSSVYTEQFINLKKDIETLASEYGFVVEIW